MTTKPRITKHNGAWLCAPIVGRLRPGSAVSRLGVPFAYGLTPANAYRNWARKAQPIVHSSRKEAA